MTAVLVSTVETQAAYATSLDELRRLVPATTAIEGTGAVEAVAGGVVVVGTAPEWVSAAVGVTAAYGVAYGIDKAVSWAFHWGSSHSPTVYAHPASPGTLAPGQSVTINGITFTAEPYANGGTTNCGTWWGNGCWGVDWTGGASGGQVRFTCYSGGSCASAGSNGTVWSHAPSTLSYYTGPAPSGVLVASVTPCGMGYTCDPGSPGDQYPQIRTTPMSTCQNVTTGVITTVGGTAYTYRGNDTAPPTMVEPACPSGTVRIGGSFPTVDVGTGATVNPPAHDWSVTIPSAFAECQDLANPCELTLTRIAGSGTSQQVCNNSAACSGWMTQAHPTGTSRTVKTGAGGDVAEKTWVYSDGDHLDCKFGPYLMQTTECSTVPTESATGTGTGTSTGGDPDGGAQDCWPNGWSSLLRPDQYVLQPIKCALVWAFVPSSTTTDTLTEMKNNLGSRAPFGYVAAGSSWIAGAVPSGDCTTRVQLGLTFPVFGHITVLDTDDTVGVYSVFKTYRTLLSVCLYLALIVGLLGWAWKAYAPGTAGNS